MSAFDLIKKDLAEFTQTVTQDTSKLVSGSTALVKDVLAKSAGGEPLRGDGRGIHQIVSSLTKTYASYDDADAQPLRISGGTFETFDRYKARLQSIQTNPGTFCTDPDDVQDFNVWMSTFDVDSMKSTIAELLVDSGPIRALYTKLVPTALSHTVFWQRYFYRVHLLEADEARKAKLKHRADKLQSEKEQLSWPDKDDWDRDDEYGTSPRQTVAYIESLTDTKAAAATAIGVAELGTSTVGAAAVDAGAALAAASADAVAAAAGAEALAAAVADANIPFCAAAVALPADTAIVQVVPLPLSMGTGYCANDSSEVPDNKSGDTSLHSAQPEGSAMLSPVTRTIEDNVQMAAATATKPDASLPTIVGSAPSASVPTAPIATSPARIPSPVHVEAPGSILKTSAGDAASAEKDSLTELVDLQPDPNVDSDWEKEFDVTEEIASAVATADPDRTADMDRDLEWETWE